MPFNLGDFTTSETIYVPFATFDSNGASVTITGLAVTDIELIKDGSTTVRASDNGYLLLDTDGIDFGSRTGIHGFSIDLSDNSDAGFFVAGSQYWIIVDAITVDSQTVRFVFSFTIGRFLRPTTAGRTLDVASTGEAGVDLGNVTGTLGNANVSWVNGSNRIDVGTWLGTAVTVSATTALPEVDAKSISDSAAAADSVQANIGNLDAAISSLNNLSSADIIAAIEDAGQILVQTTIATLASQTSFTLSAGSADNNAYNGCFAVIEDVSTAAQKAVALIQNYVGSTKTITLRSDPGIFTMAATDKIRIMPVTPALPSGLAGSTQGIPLVSIQIPNAPSNGVGGLLISNAGSLDMDQIGSDTAAILVDTGTTLDDHLTDIKGTGFVKDTHSLIDIETFVDLIDDGTSGLVKIATDVAAIVADTNELQTDDIPTLIATSQTDLDTITGSDGVTLASAEDVYHADIDLAKDDANTKDEYSATWFKNGVRITTGITSPTIQVVKRADGTDLVASTAMTQIGTIGSYKYDEATNRVTAGEAVLVIVAATIDSGSRSFARVISRDST